MTITHKLSIDLLRQEPISQIHAVQDDSCRCLALTLLANGIPWKIPANVSVIIRYCKADGIGGAYDTLPDGSCAWSCAGHMLTVALAPQVFTAAGEVTLAVQLIQGEETVSTFDITLNVHPGIHKRIKISEPYINIAPEEEAVPQNALAAIGAKIISGGIRSIVLLGDSITDGAGGAGYNGSYSSAPSTNTAGYCWANVFKKLVEARYGIPVTNMGMYGTAMVTQMETALPQLTKDDFVIWLTGTNDRNQPDAYADGLLANLEAVRNRSAGLLVLSGIPATAADEQNHTVSMRKMDEIITAAVEGATPFISMYQEFCSYCDVHSISLSDCFADHVHPNDLGHYIIFRLLCAKLGLPLDAYTDYQADSLWWNPAQQERILADNTYSYSHSDFSSSFSLSSGVVPGVFMAGFDPAALTTDLSNKHITKMLVMVYYPGTITFGTVDLNDVGQRMPSYTKSQTVTATSGGVFMIHMDLDIGAHETLAFHSPSDTGTLAFLVGSTTQEDPVRFWTSSNFESGTEQCIVVFGAIYGYGPETEYLLLDGTDDYTGTANDTMILGDSIVPVVLMTDYDSASATTAVSGKHITRALMRVNTVGTITIGKVDLTTIGTTPVFLESRTFQVTETGDEVEFLLDMDVGPHETLAFQTTSDTGKLGFIVTTGDLFIWKSSDYAAGAASTTLMLWGKLYSK